MTHEQELLVTTTVRAAVAEAENRFMVCVTEALKEHIIACPAIKTVGVHHKILYGNSTPGLSTRIDRIEQARTALSGWAKPVLLAVLTAAATAATIKLLPVMFSGG